MGILVQKGLIKLHVLTSGLGLDLSKVSTLDNNKGFINLCFLQKLKWMKTVWDQARLSSLV